MGQKTHPRGLRLGIIETWDSKWYSDRDYAKWLHEDFKIQQYVKEKLECVLESQKLKLNASLKNAI